MMIFLPLLPNLTLFAHLTSSASHSDWTCVFVVTCRETVLANNHFCSCWISNSCHSLPPAFLILNTGVTCFCFFMLLIFFPTFHLYPSSLHISPSQSSHLPYQRLWLHTFLPSQVIHHSPTCFIFNIPLLSFHLHGISVPFTSSSFYFTSLLFLYTFASCLPPQVDWPLNIIITDSCMNKYNRLFSFLLQLKHMVWSLRDVWFHLKRTGEQKESCW